MVILPKYEYNATLDKELLEEELMNESVSKTKKYVFYAILAAALYALSTPFSKLLLVDFSPTMMAGLLYFGAGLGMFVVWLVRRKVTDFQGKPFTKKQMPYVFGMIALDIIAPILLMLGLTYSNPENVSLLNNFEIVATSLIALFVFKELVSRRLWLGIIFITFATVVLSLGDVSAFQFSIGSLFVILACISWGLENNCTRLLSNNDPLKVVIIKGIFSGIGSLSIALVLGEFQGDFLRILLALLLGFVAYGMSVYLYVHAQRGLGASKTSAYYAVAPFIGVIIAFLLFRQIPNYTFFIALFLMAVGTYFASTPKREKKVHSDKETIN